MSDDASDEQGDAPGGAHTERFRELAGHPELEQWLSTPPEEDDMPEGRRLDTGCLLAAVLTLVVLGVIAAFISTLLFPPLAFVPVALLVVGVLALFGRRKRPWEKLPLESGLSYVEETRASVDGGAPLQGSPARLKARLLFADGSRRDVDVLEGAGRETSTGAYGVAYLRGLWLVGFRLIDSPPGPSPAPAGE